jgi:hypothetical protein
LNYLRKHIPTIISSVLINSSKKPAGYLLSEFALASSTSSSQAMIEPNSPVSETTLESVFPCVNVHQERKHNQTLLPLADCISARIFSDFIRGRAESMTRDASQVQVFDNSGIQYERSLTETLESQFLNANYKINGLTSASHRGQPAPDPLEFFLMCGIAVLKSSYVTKNEMIMKI